jgi:hypothetical protein
MKGYFRLPLIFLSIAAILGVMLRWQFVSPIAGLKFSNWLHAHSHTMFLGWVFNVLFLAYIHRFIPQRWSRLYKVLFTLLQFLVTGLLISFPIQGYGAVSITLLSLHILGSFVFAFFFFRHTSSLQSTPSLYFVRFSLILGVVSSIGAFALGPISAMGLQQSQWYYFSIFFYLHFQYNGLFVFGVFGLFLHQLEEWNVGVPSRQMKLFALPLAIASVPAYLLSVVWSNPGNGIVGVALVSAILQVVSLYGLGQIVVSVFPRVRSRLGRGEVVLFAAALLAYAIKIILQLLSGVPALADTVTEVRFFVLAYLHLVLIGFVSFFLLTWLSLRGIINGISLWMSVTLLVFFTLHEVFMVATPLFGSAFYLFSALLFICSAGMASCFCFFLLRTRY